MGNGGAACAFSGIMRNTVGTLGSPTKIGSGTLTLTGTQTFQWRYHHQRGQRGVDQRQLARFARQHWRRHDL